MENTEKLRLLAPDLSKDFPRSPRQLLGGYVVAGRTLDKCRALLAGTLGEYKYDCPLDNFFFDFAGITAAAYKEIAATGAADDEIAAWLKANAQKRPTIEIIRWNNQMRDKRISQLPDELQEFLEGYIPQYLPRNRRVYCWFDVYDIEEQRI